MKLTSLLSILLVSAGLVACGGGDDGSGVDTGKAINEVTPAEASDVCEYMDGLIAEDDAKKVGCVLFALAFSETADECQMSFDACMASDEQPTDEDDCNVTQAEIDEMPACSSDVTVGEMEACANASADLYGDLASSLSCNATPQELEQLSSLPSECAPIQEKCPELLDDDESDQPQ